MIKIDLPSTGLDLNTFEIIAAMKANERAAEKTLMALHKLVQGLTPYDLMAMSAENPLRMTVELESMRGVIEGQHVKLQQFRASTTEKRSAFIEQAMRPLIGAVNNRASSNLSKINLLSGEIKFANENTHEKRAALKKLGVDQAEIYRMHPLASDEATQLEIERLELENVGLYDFLCSYDVSALPADLQPVTA